MADLAMTAGLADLMNSRLQPVQRCVATSGLDQYLVGAIFDQAAALERDDAICGAYRGEAVRDDQDRPLLGDLLHVVLNGALALIVEGACCFVEDQDARVGDERAGDGDALTLPTRKR